MKERKIALLCLMVIAVLLIGCTPKNASNNPHQQSISDIQPILGIPKNSVQFVENTTMTNSPDGKLKVALYRDNEDRKYYVDLETNIVVEIDARSILAVKSNGPEEKTQEELQRIAEACAKRIIPGFEEISRDLSFEGSGKEDNYFFSWSKKIKENAFMPEFLQFGYSKEGELFAYYNTLQIME
jgi:hypothetical protein